MRPNDYVGTVAGRFVDTPTPESLSGTILEAEFFNSISFELLNLITKSGQSPTKSDLNQVYIAVNTIAEKITQNSLNTLKNNLLGPVPLEQSAIKIDPGSPSAIQLNNNNLKFEIAFSGPTILSRIQYSGLQVPEQNKQYWNPTIEVFDGQSFLLSLRLPISIPTGFAGYSGGNNPPGIEISCEYEVSIKNTPQTTTPVKKRFTSKAFIDVSLSEGSGKILLSAFDNSSFEDDLKKVLGNLPSTATIFVEVAQFEAELFLKL